MKRIVYVSLGLLLFLSCQQRTAVEIEVGVMRVHFIHPDAKTKVTNTEFESGDEIGLFVVEAPAPLQVSGNYINNLQATFNGTNWTGSSSLRWPSNTSTCDLYGYYPHMDVTSIVANPFCVSKDQSAGIGASDFIWGKVFAQDYTTDPIPLEFQHKLSKITLNLVKGSTYEGDYPTDAVFYIHGTVPDATIDFTTGSVTKDLYGSAQTITCHKVSDSQYEAIIIPQRIATRTPLFEMVSHGVSYLVEGTFNFKPGINYAFDVTLNASTESIRIEIGGEIEDWQ